MGYPTNFSLASGKLLLGDSGNQVAHVAPTGDVTITNAGVTAIGANKVTKAMLGANLGLGIIDLSIFAARELSTNATINAAGNGGVLASDSTPTIEAITSAKEIGIHYAVTVVDEIAWAVALPPDFDDTVAATFKCRAKKGTNTDTVTFTVQAFFGVAGTDAGGATGNIPLALGTVSVALTQANQVAYPANLTVSLLPGTHANDTIQLLAAWIEYTRKT